MLKSAIRKAVNAVGYDIHRKPPSNEVPAVTVSPPFSKIHYGCYKTYLHGWLNVDILKEGPANYMFVNLITRHPFPDDYFSFGFTEDFIEHLTQADSITFLAEAHRTLKRGGVLRVSFPRLESILSKLYPSNEFSTLMAGKLEAYDRHGHQHFYCAESLALVAKHIGFSVELVQIGRSKHPELSGLDTRLDQADTNIHAELTKL